MRRMLMVLMAALAFSIAGCGISDTAKRIAVTNEAAAIRFVELLDKGETTRDQEQKYIRAQAGAWTAFRDALGIEKGK